MFEHLRVLPPEVQGELDAALKLLTAVGMLPNREWPIHPLLKHATRAVRMASEPRSKKFQGLVRKLGEDPERPQLPIFHSASEIDENVYKNHQLVAGDPGIISIGKAYTELPPHNPERAEALAEWEVRTGIAPQIQGGEFVFSTGNDVMQRLRGNGQVENMFKPTLLTTELDHTKLQIWHGLRNTVGVNSPYQEDGFIEIDLIGATAVHELSTNIGYMRRDTVTFKCRVASDEVLTALVFGLDGHEDEISPELRAECMRIFNEHVTAPDDDEHRELRKKQIDRLGWNPERGFSNSLTTRVNGGWKVDNILIMELLVTHLNGVAIDDDMDEFFRIYDQAQELAVGVPVQFQELYERILEKIMHLASGVALDEATQEDEVVLDELVGALRQEGIPAGGRWYDVTPISSIERAQNTNRTINLIEWMIVKSVQKQVS